MLGHKDAEGGSIVGAVEGSFVDLTVKYLVGALLGLSVGSVMGLSVGSDIVVGEVVLVEGDSDDISEEHVPRPCP